jgi:histidyl-tRNA synthetase
MVADAEAITIACEILTELPVGKFQVKLNHRCLLDAIFEICGVPADKFRPICSAVDKLDKAPWEEVCREMVEEKGLSVECAEKIGKFVLNADEPMALWKRFTEEGIFGDHKAANEALATMKTLFDYLEAMGSIQHVSFDMSLARGLDYYTGVIYEMVIMEGNTRVGSIAAGGRYDNLVGMFSVSNTQTPCVGVGIGIERVFTIIEQRAKEKNLMGQSDIQVYIASIGGNTLAHRMRIARELWNANVPAEYSHKENPKLKPQMDECLEKGIPFMVVFGDEEMNSGVVKMKNMELRTETEVKLEDLAATLIAEGCRPILKSDGVLELLR